MDPNVFETANAGFAQVMYEQYLRDPASVAPEWRQLFGAGTVGLNGQNGHVEAPGTPEAPPASATPAAATAQSATVASAAPAAMAPANAPNQTPLKGPALRLAQNMEASLAVPTATTFRTISVRTLEQRRSQLNAALAASGKSQKLSFTQFIAFALVQAWKAHTSLGQHLLVRDGTSYRVTPEHLGLGIAVDMTRKDGSRGLVVPVIRGSDTVDFAGFVALYDGLVEKARTGTLKPDDFTGASMTLTNPGGLGTSASVPRLMVEQGSIIAVGSIGYPAEWQSVPAARLAELGISKVMTITSTYDHRIIQGAESGAFLGAVEALLNGESGYYESIATALGVTLPALPPVAVSTAPLALGAPTGARLPVAEIEHVAAAMALVKAYRTHGHLAARLDPLGTPPIGDPALDPAPLGLTPEIMRGIPASVLRVAVPGDTLADALPALEATYCGTVSYEVEHISSHAKRVWLRAQIESGVYRTKPTPEQQKLVLERLSQVEAFEKFLHKAYLGQKRFSIEGLDVMVSMLDLLIELASRSGAHEVVLGMAHRGRLNVLAHTVGKPYESLFAEFEGGRLPDDKNAAPDAGTGDVKYHHGAQGSFPVSTGRAMTVTLVPNPSHLEFVGAVVDGRARAEQTNRKGKDAIHDPSTVMPVVIHGDAAFAGQGVVAETLNLGNLKGYGTGGTIHLIANNQVGFTTDAVDARSTRYASDLAKGFDVPIIHVNADDPDACRAAMRLAMAYRERFGDDVLIDIVGYRRHGHNEGDEPSYTQPVMYARIKDHPTVRERYADRLIAEGTMTRELVEQQYQAVYQRLIDIQQAFKGNLGARATSEVPRVVNPGVEVETAVPAQVLQTLNDRLLSWPDGFTVNPKLIKQLDRRRVAIGPDGGIDWAHAEALAFASMLTEGIPVRLTGQDTERGTFSQRQMVLHDMHTGKMYAPIAHLQGATAPLELHNSPLSELATLGFEYGYSVAASESMVVWEAQFGDFINGAQVIVDQFLVAGLSKWGVTTRLTLLLPHGYEGQGPEHSSARLERFLQLAAEGNIRVANPTTPAQYFHMLRRQARRTRQRPLIVMTPKSLLRLPAATSNVRELSSGQWMPVLNDPTLKVPASATRVVLCSGKLYYELAAERDRKGLDTVAIVRIEQLYSFPGKELTAALATYANATKVVWAQEEPRNMGAWTFAEPRIRELMTGRAALVYAGRPERASTAEGYPAAHVAQQAAIIEQALIG